MKKWPHQPAAFINAIAEEGSKAEAVEWLQNTWNEHMALVRAVQALYFAGYWHADRPVDEAALWTAAREAAGIPPGTTAERLGPDRSTAAPEVDPAITLLREALREQLRWRSCQSIGACRQCVDDGVTFRIKTFLDGIEPQGGST